MNSRTATLPLLLALAHGCASTPRPQPSGPDGAGTPVGADGTARARAALAPPPPAPGCLSALPTLSEPAQGPFEIRASAPNSDIVVTGASDLPTGPASTQGAWTRSAEARLRAVALTLAECLRPLCAPARHRLRLSVSAEGVVSLRPPQSFPMPTRVARCLEGTVAAVDLDTPPPRTVPLDLVVQVR